MKSEKRKAPCALDAINDLEYQVAKLRRIDATTLTSEKKIEFENNIKTHIDNLENLYVTFDAQTDKAKRHSKYLEKSKQLTLIVTRLLPHDTHLSEIHDATVFDNGRDVLHALSHSTAPQLLASVTFRVENYERLYWCGIELDTDMQLTFVCELHRYPIMDCVRVCIDTHDLQVFDGKFRRAIRSASPEYGRAFDTRPTLAYVLLSMLVYSEDVFAPIGQKTVQRTQIDVDERCVRDVLGKFWTYGRHADDLKNVIAPFLMRLIPSEFALTLKLERDAMLFY